MKIIHVLNHIEEIGNGIVNVAIDLAIEQKNKGHDVAIVSRGGGFEQLISKYGIKHYQININKNLINAPKILLSLYSIIKEFKPDIVHAHMMTGAIYSKILKSISNYKLITTVHNEFQKSAIIMGVGDRVICVSNAVAKSMINRGIDKKKIRTILNGTIGSVRVKGTEELHPKNLKGISIVTVAGMNIRKGIAELLDAFEKISESYPDANLYIVGDGPDRSLFEAKANKIKSVDRIHFEGFQNEPLRYMMGADIFILASHKDPCPLVLSEARNAGCAIIGSNVDGIPEALDNGKAGILVKAGDSEELAEALEKLLNNPFELEKWKEQSRRNLERFTVNRVTQETLNVYGEMYLR